MVDWCALAGSITFCKARTHTHIWKKWVKASEMLNSLERKGQAVLWFNGMKRFILKDWTRKSDTFMLCVCVFMFSTLFPFSNTPIPPHPPSLQHFLPSAHPRSGNLDNPGCIAKTNVKRYQPAVAVGASLLSAHSVCVCRCVYKCLYHTVCLSLVCFSFGWYFFNTLKMWLQRAEEWNYTDICCPLTNVSDSLQANKKCSYLWAWWL